MNKNKLSEEEAKLAEHLRVMRIRRDLYESILQASRLGVDVTEMTEMMICKFSGHRTYRSDWVMVYALSEAIKIHKEIMDSGMSLHDYEQSKSKH
jgi:hypothetical protein